MLGFFYINATAKKPISIAVRKKAAKDTLVQNFKVCKNNIGYAVCGETPTFQNSTYPEPPHRPEYTPDYEKDRACVILLPGIPGTPKVIFPYDKEGPDTQSGEFVGISCWRGAW